MQTPAVACPSDTLWSVFFTTQYKTGIHRHQTPPLYRNAARGGPSHGHRGSAHQISWRSVQRFHRYARGQPHAQTDKLIAILRSPPGRSNDQVKLSLRFVRFILISVAVLGLSVWVPVGAMDMGRGHSIGTTMSPTTNYYYASLWFWCLESN